MHTRTTLTAFALSLGLASNAAAAPVYTETVVHDTTTNVEIDLNASTVLCSAADYSGLFFKILIPELAPLTLLDHQNTGAGAPCVSAGPCHPGNEPSDIIDPAHPTETVAINVQAVRADQSDADTQTCNTFLIERVKVAIRGKDFFHEQFADLGTRPYADCVTSQVEPEPAPVDPDGNAKTDAHVDPPSAGCSGGGGGNGSLGALVVIGALVARRRRSRHARSPGARPAGLDH
jgi:MYXO-CTERM domain-containing protein